MHWSYSGLRSSSLTTAPADPVPEATVVSDNGKPNALSEFQSQVSSPCMHTGVGGSLWALRCCLLSEKECTGSKGGLHGTES